MADKSLSEKIEALFEQGQGTYGMPTIYRLLKKQGVVCSRKRVARLMRENNLVCKTARRFKVTTTDSKHNRPVFPNLLAQDFNADGPNEKWVSDITYIPTAQGWLYLATVMDLYSRQIVGWAMSNSLHRQLVIDALQMAIEARKPPPGLIHHSDRGSQYASADYQNLLTQAKMVGSMSRKGNCYDNAAMESFFGSLKNERVHHRNYKTKSEAKTDIFEYIESF
jgi:transposase InsO family protein